MERIYQARLKDTEEVLCRRLKKADNFIKRFAGLMGRKGIVGDGLFLEHVSSIHTCFMRFPIGVVYLNQHMEVLDRQVLREWRVGRLVKGAAHVIEVRAGEEQKFPEGGELEILKIRGTD